MIFLFSPILLVAVDELMESWSDPPPLLPASARPKRPAKFAPSADSKITAPAVETCPATEISPDGTTIAHTEVDNPAVDLETIELDVSDDDDNGLEDLLDDDAASGDAANSIPDDIVEDEEEPPSILPDSSRDESPELLEPADSVSLFHAEKDKGPTFMSHDPTVQDQESPGHTPSSSRSTSPIKGIDFIRQSRFSSYSFFSCFYRIGIFSIR